MTYDARLYALLHRGSPGDVDFYVRHAAGSVLELGAGFGRVTIALAEAEGVDSVVGLDVEPTLLERTPEHAKIETRVADMRDFRLQRRFDRIYAPHGSVWCLLSEDDVRGCFRCVREHLAPGGRFVFDAWAADEMHAEADPEDVDEDHLDLVAEVVDDERPLDVLERSTWDRAAQRLDVTYLYVAEDGEVVAEGLIRQRYLLAPQIERLLEEAGMKVERMLGDFDGRPFAPTEDRIVVEASLRP